MSCINAAALVILGILLLRKLVLMDRFFAARVAIITTILCGLFLFLIVPLVVPSSPTCMPLPPPPEPVRHEFYICSEF